MNKKINSSFKILAYKIDDYILIKDLALENETMSITNDAENVVEVLLSNSDYSLNTATIFYVDIEGRIDILKHDGKQFIGFDSGFDNLKDFWYKINSIQSFY